MNIAYLFQSIGFQFWQSFAVQLHIYHQIRGLQQIGHNVSLLGLHGKRVLCTDDLAAVRAGRLTSAHFGKLGVTGSAPYTLAEGAVRRIQSMVRWPYLALFDSVRMVDAYQKNLRHYDLIHERYNLMSLGAAVASRRNGVPYVLEVNADLIDERDFQGRPDRGLRRAFAVRSTRFCFEAAHKIICVSSQLGEHLARKWQLDPRKIEVVPNAADTEAFARTYDIGDARQKYGLTGEPVIMFVGGFYPWHDLGLLVDAFSKVLQQMPQARLVLVGDGQTRAEIEQKIARNGVRHAVIMTGAVPHEQIPQLLAVADVAVAPNISFFHGHGGSPLKLYEYMAAGKAIVATHTGQVAEVIEDGRNGLLLPPGDMDGWGNALSTLLSDVELRRCLGETARRQAREQHSWQQYAQRLEKIYAVAQASAKGQNAGEYRPRLDHERGN